MAEKGFPDAACFQTRPSGGCGQNLPKPILSFLSAQETPSHTQDNPVLTTWERLALPELLAARVTTGQNHQGSLRESTLGGGYSVSAFRGGKERGDRLIYSFSASNEFLNPE